MLNLLLGSVACIVTSYTGIAINKKYNKRSRYYQDFSSFIRYAIEQIRSSKASVMEIVQGYYSSGDFQKSLQAYKSYMEGLAEIRTIAPYKYLDEQEKDKLSVFFKTFGSRDYYSEIEALQKEESMLAQKCEQLTTKQKTEGQLFKKLGILIGLALLLILI